MGKGSAPRPFTDRAVFEDNFDRIFGKKKEIELTPEEECSIETIEALIEIQKEKEVKRELEKSIQDNAELYKELTQDPIQKPFPHNILRQSRIDTIGQNGNEGLHYDKEWDEMKPVGLEFEYELNKSTGEVEKRFIDGVSKPNESQFDGD